MPEFLILKFEIDSDPLSRGYSSMTDQEVADDLNQVNRDHWAPLSSAEIFEAIDPSEFAALNNTMQARVDRILGLGSDISTSPNSNARAELLAIFNPGSATISNLAAIANQQISRGVEIGWGPVSANDVNRARGF